MSRLKIPRISKWIGYVALFLLLLVGILEGMIIWGWVPILWELGQLIVLGLAVLCGILSGILVGLASIVAIAKAS